MTRGMRWSLFWRSLFLQSCWNVERMQALGFSFALSPWLDRLYGTDTPGRAEAQERHQEFFNTQPYACALILGMVCAFEEKAAAAPADERAGVLARMAALKKASSASLAGAADGLFWGGLRPFCAALALVIGIGLESAGARSSLLWGVLVYLAAYNIPALCARWAGLRLGYEWKEALAAELKKVPWRARTRRLKTAAGGLGLVLAATGIASLAPGERIMPFLAAAGFVALGRLPRPVTGVQAYAGVCAAGLIAAAAGGLR